MVFPMPPRTQPREAAGHEGSAQLSAVAGSDQEVDLGERLVHLESAQDRDRDTGPLEGRKGVTQGRWHLCAACRVGDHSGRP
jgi:hypothetical protein